MAELDKVLVLFHLFPVLVLYNLKRNSCYLPALFLGFHSSFTSVQPSTNSVDLLCVNTCMYAIRLAAQGGPSAIFHSRPEPLSGLISRARYVEAGPGLAGQGRGLAPTYQGRAVAWPPTYHQITDLPTHQDGWGRVTNRVRKRLSWLIFIAPRNLLYFPRVQLCAWNLAAEWRLVRTVGRLACELWLYPGCTQEVGAPGSCVCMAMVGAARRGRQEGPRH